MRVSNQPPTFYPLFSKPETRSVDRVFLHCSASSNPDHANVDVIDMWHRKRGFNEIGYHYVIDFDGNISHGRSLELSPAAQKGNNTGTIAICLAGLRVDDFRLSQLDGLLELCHEIDWAYNGEVTFHGHCEVSTKTCPVFDYKHYLKLDADGNLNGAKPTNTKSLQIFDVGTDVVYLQRQLNIWLTMKGRTPIAIDGVFGNETADIVTDFQQANDIVPTGMVDSLTKIQLPIANIRRRG